MIIMCLFQWSTSQGANIKTNDCHSNRHPKLRTIILLHNIENISFCYAWWFRSMLMVQSTLPSREWWSINELHFLKSPRFILSRVWPNSALVSTLFFPKPHSIVIYFPSISELTHYSSKI